ncbi:insulin receptor substrate 2-B isoform X2 [Brachyhypopomus gauderio]|uniref:insulin receptor substrate 2-B isoform X2 n=1 Tax=Brachyhypopomus gauderio TaxID=698409 RepID=UPI00404334BF
MAHCANYQEGRAAMLMLETRQVGSKPAAGGGGDTSVREPPSSPVNSGGAPVHHHSPPSTPHTAHAAGTRPQQCRYQAPLRSDAESRAEPSPCPASEHAATASHMQAAPADGAGDIKKCGYLRKQKHGHKRFFVLRSSSHSGPGRLEYYDSEKKFRGSLRSAAAASSAAAAASPSKRVIYLYQCFTVNKRADSKNKHLIALYTKDEYFAIVAENEQEQEDWYAALSELMSEGKKGHMESDELEDGYGTVSPGTVFKEVWQVNVKPKGLGQTKNLTGVYRLCLSAKSIHLVKLNSETPCVNLQLMNIRRCGHSESFFFIEVGRSSSIGPGELWMQVDDSVVAQNMHETILETMKALKAFAEFRPRSKSQSSGSNPMPFITTRRHMGNLPPSQTGLQRRSRTESVVGTPPSSKSSGASGYRFRTSSEGEGTMNRPFRSVTGSLIHLNAARANLGRQDSGGGVGNRYVRAPPGAATYHARSASLPVSHFPSTTSPVSVSSSSGHGSVTDTITRPSSASICGSPSDGGFNSSDEYGSSPGDFRYFRVRSNTPDSLGNTPPIREEHCFSDYMAMGWNRDMFGNSSGEAACDEGAEEVTGSLRRRTSSSSSSRQVGSGSAGGVAVYQKMTQTNFLLDEGAVEGSALGSGSQTASAASSLRSDYSSSSEHSQDRPPALRAADSFKDDGYMPMMAGIVPSQPDDYMPMQPGAPLSAPLLIRSTASPTSSQHVDSQGYMMMLPGGGSRTDSPAPASPHVSSRAVKRREHPQNGEYMDMSKGKPAAGGHKLSNDTYYTLTTPETPKTCSSCFSLPRSYKAPARERAEHDDYVPMSSPAKPARAPDHGGASPLAFAPQHNGRGDDLVTDHRAARPNRLPLSRRSFHGDVRPSSPGEYINIEFGAVENSISAPSACRERRRSPLAQEYMSVEVDGLPPKSQSPRPSLVAPWNPPAYIRPSASSRHDGVAVARADDYAEMSSGRRPDPQNPAAMLQQLCVLERCYPSSGAPAEPKVIRADPQGRRRHSSETFVTLAPVTGGDAANAAAPASGNTLQAVGGKWRGSPSFDGTWMCVDGVVDAGEAESFSSDVAEAGAYSQRPGRTVELQNGFNYIALDLKEDPQPGDTHDAPPSPSSGLPLPENGAYASIDFIKSEGISAASKD